MTRTSISRLAAIFPFLVLSGALSTLFAATIHVPAQYASIQAAINAAMMNDTVLVAPGIYTDSISFNDRNVRVVSTSGPEVTMIYGRTVYFWYGSIGTLSGFCVAGVEWSGIRCYGSTARIENCIITRNVFGEGAGIELYGTSNCRITGNRIYQNSAAGRAGAIIGRECVNDTIANNVIYANTGVDGDLLFFNSIVAIHDNTISSQSTAAGIWFSGTGSLDVRNNIVFFGRQLAGIYQTSIGPGSIDANFNCTFHNVPSNYNFVVNSTNIAVDAQFVDSANHDYRLLLGSPCIDSGDPNPLFNDSDLSRSDIGAEPNLVPGEVSNSFFPCRKIRLQIEAPTIASALEMARDCDTIFFRSTGASAEFVGPFDWGSSSATLLGSMILIGDGSSNPVLKFGPHSNAKVHGIFVRNGAGQGIEIDSSNIHFKDCTVESVSGGSGISGRHSTLRIENCVIHGNNGHGAAGGIQCDGCDKVVVEGCKLFDNSSTGSGTTMRLTDNTNDTIRHNVVYGSIGTDLISLTRTSAVLYDNTMIGDSVSTLVKSDGIKDLDVRNNILMKGGFPTAVYFDTLGGGEVAAQYNCVFANANASFSFTVDSTNINSAPLLRSIDSADFQILIESPCRNAGDPNSFYNDDDGTRNDIGALSLGPPLGACCVGMTGNVDCDVFDEVNISDLTILVDYLFISFTPACCYEEADVNSEGGVDISDLTLLVDHLFLTFEPLSMCQ